MTAVKDLGPLDYRIAITDQNGRPSPEFQRRWDAQRINNGLFVTLSFGTGAPTDAATVDGTEYIDTSTTPYTLYVVRSGAWHKVGPYSFTDLTDTPHTYSGAAGKLVRVNAGATALELDSLSTVLDSLGSTRGDILYRNASGWVVLAPGTSGYILQTGGAGADPSWITAPISLPSIANNDLLANTSGSAAVPVATTVSALLDSALGSTQGDILYRNSSGWVVLPPGTSSQLLQTGGAGANPSWTNAPTSMPSISNNNLLANTSGSTTTPVGTTLSTLLDSAIGSTQGDIIYRNASGWVVLAPGTSGYVLQTGGAGADPSWVAQPVLGLTVQTQSGTTWTPGLSDNRTYTKFSNASGCTVTIPPQSSVAWGTTPAPVLAFEQSTSLGTVTIQGGSGVTINTLSIYHPWSYGQYAVMQLIRTSSNTWTLFGAQASV